MPERYQYPALTEPPFQPAAPDTSTDEIAATFTQSQPLFDVPRSLAALVAGAVMVVGAVVPLQADHEAAIRPAEQPLFDAPRAVDVGGSFQSLEPIVEIGDAQEAVAIYRQSQPVFDVARSRAAVVSGAFQTHIPPPVPKGGGGISLENPKLTRIFQYQQKAEPVTIVVEAAPDFGWFVQGIDQVAETPAAVNTGGMVVDVFITGERFIEDVLTRWWRPASEPLFVPPSVMEGISARAPPDPVLFIPDFDWLPAPNLPPDPVLRATDVGYFAENFQQLILDLDWWRQPVEVPATAPRPVDEGGPSIQPDDDPRNFVPPFDWFRQPVEVPDVEPPREPGLLVSNLQQLILDTDWLRFPELPLFPPTRIIDVPPIQVEILPAADVIDFGWFRPPSEPLFAAPPSPEGTHVRPDDDPLNFVPSFGWWRPPVAVPDTAPPVEPGWLASNLQELILDLDWWRQPVEVPATPPRAVDVGLHARPDEDPRNFVPAFDWWRLPEIPDAAPPREPGWFAQNLQQLILDLDWLVAPADVVIAPTTPLTPGVLPPFVEPPAPAPDFTASQVADVIEPERRPGGGIFAPLEPIVAPVVPFPGPDVVHPETRPEGFLARPIINFILPTFEGWARQPDVPVLPAPRIIDVPPIQVEILPPFVPPEPEPEPPPVIRRGGGTLVPGGPAFTRRPLPPELPEPEPEVEVRPLALAGIEIVEIRGAGDFVMDRQFWGAAVITIRPIPVELAISDNPPLAGKATISITTGGTMPVQPETTLAKIRRRVEELEDEQLWGL